MHNLAELAKELHRPVVYVTGLQARFGLPVVVGRGYSEAYLAFLEVVVRLRILCVREETLRELWEVEKKLLGLLHVDTASSPTWFLDACGQQGKRGRRLLLTNYDLGPPMEAGSLQLGLDFSDSKPELFLGKEMGEDALRVLRDYRRLVAEIREKVRAEVEPVKQALRWAGLWEKGGG